MKISDIFLINQGHQITDEEIYLSSGDIPILTANNEIKGYGKHSIVEKKHLPCLTYPSKAFSGKVYVQTRLFDANNTAILIPKEKYRDEMNLQYFAIILGKLFLNYLSSESQVNYLGKHSLSNIEITYPFLTIEEQNIIVEQYKKLEQIKTNILLEIDRINNLLSCSFESRQGSGVKKIYELFNIYGGNSGLTEAVIYNSQSSSDDHIKVISASLQKSTQMGYINKNIVLSNRPLKVFNSGRLVVTRKGNAGKMMFIDEIFTINDDAYVIDVKEKYRQEINMKYFMIIGEKYSELATNMDGANATFSKSFFEQQEIPYPFPPIEEQNTIVEQYDKLTDIKNKLQSILLRISI